MAEPHYATEKKDYLCEFTQITFSHPFLQEGALKWGFSFLTIRPQFVL